MLCSVVLHDVRGGVGWRRKEGRRDGWGVGGRDGGDGGMDGVWV